MNHNYPGLNDAMQEQTRQTRQFISYPSNLAKANIGPSTASVSMATATAMEALPLVWERINDSFDELKQNLQGVQPSHEELRGKDGRVEEQFVAQESLKYENG